MSQVQMLHCREEFHAKLRRSDILVGSVNQESWIDVSLSMSTSGSSGTGRYNAKCRVSPANVDIPI